MQRGKGNNGQRMTWLPVVERELRVAARRRGTYWSRLAQWFRTVAAEGMGPKFRAEAEPGATPLLEAAE